MDLKNKFCAKPFEFLEIGYPQERGVLCHACCPNQLPKEIGNLKNDTLLETWNSQSIQDIRRSIHEGTFEYCVKEQCPIIQAGELPDKYTVSDKYLKKIIQDQQVVLDRSPKIINLSYDQTCNLSCPSCRVDYISHNGQDAQELFSKIGDEIVEVSGTHTERLLFCSSGDPFASQHFKNLLKNLNFSKNPNLKIQIVTNGLLFSERVWSELSNIHGRIEGFCVSIDAASSATYEIVRRGGDWDRLLRNLEFIKKLRKSGQIPYVKYDFVVQDHNFREMPQFVDLGKRFEADFVFFQRIINWGTFSNEEFLKRAVYLSEHPLYDEFVEVCKDKRMRDTIVDGGNLSSFIGRPKRRFRLFNAIKHSLQKRVPFLRF